MGERQPTSNFFDIATLVIDSVTKRRYHEFLAAKINPWFPNEEQVAADDRSPLSRAVFAGTR